MVWLDCCYSGELLNFQKNLYEARLGQREGYSRCFIAASRGDEKALGNVTSSYGEFTNALLQGLDPANSPNGWVTSAILTEAVNRFLTIGEQHPLAYNFGTPIILTTGRKTQQSQDICPYKGLEYFTQKDADLFYGRTALINELVQKVDESNFVALLGASGSGKSSVLRAGLLHQLSLGQISESHTWQLYEPFIPGEHPLQSLEKAIGRKADELEALIAEATAKRVVITVDQFEECFTLCQDKQERQQFFDFLLKAVAGLENKLCLILGIRADFLGKCLEYPHLAQYIRQNQVSVAPMTEAELEEAIKEPAKQVDLQVEESLVNRLLEDVQNSPGSLPLLEYTLAELWKARKEAENNYWLTLASYEQLGGEKRGIKGILEKRANEVYEDLLSTKERPVAKYIFLSLTQLNEDAENTRKRKRIADLETSRYSKDLIDQVLQKLTNERLIVTQIPESDLGNLAVVEVVHEILIREWGLLRGWINENRKFLIQQKEIEAAAEDWQTQEKKKKKDYLIQGKRLGEAKNFQKEQADLFPLSTLAEKFIRASVWQRRRRFTLIGSVFLVVAIYIGATTGIIQELLAIWLNEWGHAQYAAGQNLDREGQTQNATKYYNNAIWYFDMALAIKPGHLITLYNRGLAHEALGNDGQAKTDYEAIRQIKCFAPASGQLARLLIKLDQNYTRAVRLSEEGVSCVKNDIDKYALYKNLGWAHLGLGNYDKAQDALQESITLDNQRGSAYCLLAQVLEAQDFQVEARGEWNNCLQFGVPTHPDEKIWIKMANQRLQ